MHVKFSVCVGGGEVGYTQLFNYVPLFETLWTVARQAPLSMGFPKQEYQSGLPFPPPGDLHHSGTEPASPELVGGFFSNEPPEKPHQV